MKINIQIYYKSGFCDLKTNYIKLVIVAFETAFVACAAMMIFADIESSAC